MADQHYTIIHEDDWFVAANKAIGVASQTDKSGDRSLIEALQERYDTQLYVVHRIDRPASGLVLFARSKEAAAGLSDLFRNAKVERNYWAIVGTLPDPPEGRLRHNLVTDSRTNKSRVVKSGGQEASLEYRLVAKSERYFLLDVKLETGRHHQIRAQLSAIGSPIRGDLKYGARRSIPGGGIGLHARRLGFSHPRSGELIALCAPPPIDGLWNALTEGL